MTSDLSIIAGRIRDFIAICADEFSSEHRNDPAHRAHADAEFSGLALMLFTLQFQQNAAYRKLCALRNIAPNSIAHWSEIPAAPTSAFKEFELTSLAPADRTAEFHSSGTTGQTPSRHFHSAESLAVYESSALTWFRFHIPKGKRLVILTPPGGQVPNSSLVHMFETVQKDFGETESCFTGRLAPDNSWMLDFDAAIQTLEEAVRRNESVVLLGTAFSFVHLLDCLVEKNLRFKLPPGSLAMETGGYKNRSRILPKEELHVLIAERLGIPQNAIACEYGMSELSSQAYDGVASDGWRVTGDDNVPRHSSLATGHFCFPPWARVQIISPETGCEVAEGGTGLIRIFDLANVFSVMAIQTEDLGVRRGDGFELIGRAAMAEARGCSLKTI